MLPIRRRFVRHNYRVPPFFSGFALGMLAVMEGAFLAALIGVCLLFLFAGGPH